MSPGQNHGAACLGAAALRLPGPVGRGPRTFFRLTIFNLYFVRRTPAAAVRTPAASVLDRVAKWNAVLLDQIPEVVGVPELRGRSVPGLGVPLAAVLAGPAQHLHVAEVDSI